MKGYKLLAALLAVVLLLPAIILGTASGERSGSGQDGQTAAAEEDGLGSVEAAGRKEAGVVKTAAAGSGAGAPAGMELADENDQLQLYYDPATTEVAVRDKRTGTLWRTNPEDREADALAVGTNKRKLSSQLGLIVYNDAGLLQEFDNYTDSIINEQFTAGIVDGALKFVYTLGDVSIGIDAVPQKISVERMEERILSRIEDASVRSDLLKRFKLLPDEQIYERRDAAIQEVHLKRLTAVFQEVGYTLEDTAFDNEQNGIATEGLNEKPVFVLSLEYRLDGEHLVVSVPADEIGHPASYVVHSLRVLENFGAAGTSESGYLFVPDGSGALIRLNNGKLRADPYLSALYGADGSRHVKVRQQTDESSRLPVYGLKRGDDAFLAIIEDGDALASIEADISGRRHSYNVVYPSFLLSAKDEMTLTGNTTTQTTPIFQAEMYSGDLQIRYGFLSGERADYSGMAAHYRDYLADRHGWQRIAGSLGEDMPFFLELTGGITKKKSFLGIPYQSVVPLTTFEQAQEIADELQADGIDSIKLRYTGWFNKGVAHKPPDSLSIDGGIGGKKGLADLADYAKENGIDLYPDVAFLNVNSKSFGFSASKEAARFINRRSAKLYPFSLSTYEWNERAQPYYVLSPHVLPGYVDRFLDRYERLGIGGISLRDIGNEVNADYRDNRVIDRQEALAVIAEQTGIIRERAGDVLIVGGNAPTLPYASAVLQAPLSSSKFAIADESVPFYQMVVHGYVDYAGQPLNLQSDQDARKSVLKLLETGSGLYYQWFYAPAHEIKETDFDYMYAGHYGDWIDEAKALYAELNPIMSELRDQLMVRHEKLDENVYQTVYENGTAIVVNYGKERAVVDGLAVEAEGYAVLSEGRKLP